MVFFSLTILREELFKTLFQTELFERVEQALKDEADRLAKKLEELAQERQQIWTRYREELAGLGLGLPAEPEPGTPTVAGEVIEEPTAAMSSPTGQAMRSNCSGVT